MFNIEEFDIKLDTEYLGRNFVYCEDITSTNSFILESEQYDKNGTVVMAEFQSTGRGRRERKWTSNKDQNLTFSMLLKHKIKGRNLNILNLASSITVANSIENLFQVKVDLKWPNDVLINGRKVAGILIETSSRGSSINKAAIGIGINVNQASFTGDYNIEPTSIRREFRREASRERLLSEFLNNFEDQIEVAINAPEKILEDWKAKCKMLGEKIKITDGESIRYGIFEDLDEQGFIVLKTESGLESVNIGDVSII